jgi:hypothetical protein
VVSSGGAVAADEVGLAIEAEVAGDRATVSGKGRCTHTDEASIYGTPAAMWRVEDSDAESIRHASLTVWRPKSGGVDQFSFSLSTASGDHRIDTVKGSQLVGSGTITVRSLEGGGARFDILGQDADGRPVRVTFQCARFTPPRVEGG